MSYKTEVAVVKDIDTRRRILEALKLVGGMNRVVDRGDKVFVKPNLVDGAPFETGEVVQLEVMQVLVEEAFRAGASEVIIGETPTVRKKTETMKAYEQLAKRLGAKFLNLYNYPFIEVKVKNPVQFSKVRLSKVLFDCDTFINVPTLKTHTQCGITVAIKNMYGLIPREDKRLYHKLDKVEEAIIDLYQARKADLIVVDGTYTTFHIGPRPVETFKETFRLNLALAGFDPVAVDAVSAKILGMKPETLRYLRWGERKELGTMNLSNIKILGASIEEVCFEKAVDAVRFVNTRMKNIKILNYGACTGCLRLSTGAMWFGDELFKDTIYLVMGPKANKTKVKRDMKKEGKVILCGYCAAPSFYNGLQGEFIAGCPPAYEDLWKKLREILINQNC